MESTRHTTAVAIAGPEPPQWLSHTLGWPMRSKSRASENHSDCTRTIARAQTHDIPLKSFPKDHLPGGVREGLPVKQRVNKLAVGSQEEPENSLVSIQRGNHDLPTSQYPVRNTSYLSIYSLQELRKPFSTGLPVLKEKMS